MVSARVPSHFNWPVRDRSGEGVLLHRQETGGNASVFVNAREVLKEVFLFDMRRRVVGCIATENCALLRHYAASSGNFLPTFRDNLAVPSSILTLEDGTDRLSRSVGKKLSLLTAS